MTAYSTLTLVGNTVYGTPSGNYDGSSQDFFSDAVSAANYYGGQGSLQTITYRLSGFVGIITMEATLNDEQDSAPWFELATFGDGTTPDSGIFSDSVVGNFTWIRARITEFTAGTIESITVAY
jgi:hypothetical protein